MSQGTKYSVLQTINEVRRLIGFKTVTKLDADRETLVHLRLLNVVVANVGDYGDWQEQYADAYVTADTTSTYSVGIVCPLQRIYEISFSGQRQALYPATIEYLNQLQRGNTTGDVSRFFALKGTDTYGNPKFTVHPVPSSAQVGNLFTVSYFKKEPIYDVTDADTEVPYPANIVVQGLYAKALLEESGGQWTKESIGAQQDFVLLMDEGLKRYNSDTGTDIYLQPKSNYSRN